MTRTALFAATLLVTATACARTPAPTAGDASKPEAGAMATAATPSVPPAARRVVRQASPVLPPVIVHKSPTCGCCGLWVEHLREAGFRVEVRNQDDLHPVKERVGVPYGKGSCHTAEVAGYFVEGHVPAQDIKRLLVEKPKAKGLVVPGMPLGSPGMEVPDGTVQPYTVELVGMDGQTRAFAEH